MTTYTVLLEGGTVGTMSSALPEDDLIGVSVTVDLHDENGTPIQATGKVEEVLESEG